MTKVQQVLTKLKQILATFQTFLSLLEQAGLSDLDSAQEIATACKTLTHSISVVEALPSEARQISALEVEISTLQMAISLVPFSAFNLICSHSSTVANEGLKQMIITAYYDDINPLRSIQIRVPVSL